MPDIPVSNGYLKLAESFLFIWSLIKTIYFKMDMSEMCLRYNRFNLKDLLRLELDVGDINQDLTEIFPRYTWDMSDMYLDIPEICMK